MAWIPYAPARALLFRLDAEDAHDLTVRTLERLQHSPLLSLVAQPRIDDPVTLAGLHFPNRVGLAAGLDKNARCIDAWAAMGFGFVEVGTVTPRPQPGNPRPRLFRLPQAEALINRFGFNNDGLDAFVRNVNRSHVRRGRAGARPLVLGLNIGKNASTPIERATDDYLIGLEGVYTQADYIAVNISSPNTQNLRQLQGDAALDGLLQALARRRADLADRLGVRRPIFVKIAPDLDDGQIAVIADALLRHGMDGVIATNTTLARDAVQGLPHAQESGGLSGRPVARSSNRVIAALRQRLGAGFPIIGVGGVMDEASARDKLAAGADLVQLYTGLIYRGPDLVPTVARALRDSRGAVR
ncbi:Dihydroorotate dehydrogenase (quinone) [Tepidimonas fonticaldi]|uniref:Dihydroorotate dehydrogenase (quinone) n=1 Tax=Tepidimonas fonticaldi TaxID=1101373 RepID=A0A554XG27_9BURK|nr:quinone-dependent dihydroorotate dehydrogenase [Tepidimonas fonticaldi]TSE34774.1 Dihydroorotate dehydrogenase (quinone) [Tepidimonas fonticaldi]